MDFLKFLDFIKLKLSSRITGFLILLVFTVIPTDYKVKLGIDKVYENYKTYITIFLIIFAVLVTVGIGEKIVAYIKPYFKGFEVKKVMRKKLNNLTDIEKDICQSALNNSGMTCLPFNEGKSASLEQHFIICRVSNHSVHGIYFSYRLNDYPIEYLKKNLHLLKIEETS